NLPATSPPNRNCVACMTRRCDWLKRPNRLRQSPRTLRRPWSMRQAPATNILKLQIGNRNFAVTFAHPYFLLLLLVLPLAAWLKVRRGRPPAFVYSSVQLLRGVQDITRSQAGNFLAAL